MPARWAIAWAIACAFGALAHADSQVTIEGLVGRVAWSKEKNPEKPAFLRQRLEPGTIIITEKNSTARLRYADGSTIIVGPESRIEIQPAKSGSEAARLEQGAIRALVKKSSPEPPSKRPRLVIRTRAVVMGVRGTEFAFEANDSLVTSKIYLFEGKVDVAKDETTLLKGLGKRVMPNEFISADATGISPPRPFDSEEYRRRNESWFNGPDELPDLTRQSLLGLRLGLTFTRQESGGEFLAPVLTFEPRFRVFRWLNAGAHLGVTPLVDRTTQDLFWCTEAAAMVGVDWGRLSLEGGAGIQSWDGRIETAPAFLGNLTWRRNPDATFKRFWLGGVWLNTPENPTIELRAGVQVEL